MTTVTTTTDPAAALRQFDRTTSLWGPITMALGLLVSLTAVLYLAFGAGLGITAGDLWTAVGPVLATFAIIAVIEPVSYFPILGRSAMYQAFMIGNISNKLLPAAIVAQANLDEKPGTRRAELIAGAAIIGAVIVHLVTLALFVGLLGTILVSVLPPAITAVARGYILPAIFGAVLVQVVVSMKALRTTIVAVVVSALMVFAVVPMVPAITHFGTAIAAIATIVLSWVFRDKSIVATGRPVSIEE